MRVMRDRWNLTIVDGIRVWIDGYVGASARQWRYYLHWILYQVNHVSLNPVSSIFHGFLCIDFPYIEFLCMEIIRMEMLFVIAQVFVLFVLLRSAITCDREIIALAIPAIN